MAANPVAWFEIYVQDIDRAKKFYESVFNIKMERLTNPDPEMWNFPGVMDKFGSPGAIVKMRGVPSGGNSTVVYFSCKDCAVETARAVKAGGHLHKEKSSLGPYGFSSMVIDTEGNLIGLHSMQ